MKVAGDGLPGPVTPVMHASLFLPWWPVAFNDRPINGMLEPNSYTDGI